MKYLIATLFGLLSLTAFPQDEIYKHFVMVSKSPHQFTYKNSLKVNHKGGHLQGIQLIQHNGQNLYVVTGSSSTYSYYATIGEVDDKYEVLKVKKLLDQPYKHAGGFQINDGYMAIGIEDNEAKNASMVFVYKANENGAWGTEPFAIIKRDGDVKRMTAGCIAVASLDEFVLVIVGDWDTKHLDFYQLDRSGNSKLLGSLETSSIDGWLSYQNINLLREKDGSFYLIGLGNKGEDDIADLYQIETTEWKDVLLKRVESRNFGSQKKTKFRWGAGVYWDEQGSLKIISCGDKLKNGAMISVYR